MFRQIGRLNDISPQSNACSVPDQCSLDEAVDKDTGHTGSGPPVFFAVFKTVPLFCSLLYVILYIIKQKPS